MKHDEANLSYEALEKLRQQAQNRLNEFIETNRASLSRYAELLNEHMHYTNLANKAMLRENVKH